MSPACPQEPPALPSVCQHPGLCSSDCDQHYWEVWVGGRTKWDLGVAAETVDWGDEGEDVLEWLLDMEPEEQDRVRGHCHPLGAPGFPESWGLPGLPGGHRGLL